jgi:nucleoside-diphosphate-sugar epimerase
VKVVSYFHIEIYILILLKAYVKILVTGGTGFIAGELLTRLQKNGYDPYNLERYAAGRYSQQKRFPTVFGDIADAASIKNVVKELQPEIIVHFAALTSVAYSYEHPVEVLEANLIGTVNLAEACRTEVRNFKKMIFTSSIESYKDTPGILQDEENTPQEPDSPYGVSKVAAEKYLIYLFRNRSFPVFIFRQTNTYGRKNDSNFIVEAIISQMLRGGPVHLGSPDPVRDFIYVSDLVDAHMRLIESDIQAGQIFNIGTSRPTSIKELADLIATKTGFRGQINWNAIPPRPREIKWLVADNKKARTQLRWTPKTGLQEGIDKTIQGWKDHMK